MAEMLIAPCLYLCAALFRLRRLQTTRCPGVTPKSTYLASLLIWSILPASAAPALTVRIANVSAPPAGTAHLAIFLDTPHTLVSGELVLDLDPKIFGNILSADVFSATGDQAGVATIQGDHLDVTFSSQTGSIGRLPGLPIMVVSVPVLTSAALNASATLSLQPGAATWKDSNNVVYAVNSVPGTLAVQGTLSVKDALPGGGSQPGGTVVRIEGTGFLPLTTVAIEGVLLSSTRLVNSQEIDVTLGGAADLSAKRVTITNPGGEVASFFSALRPNVIHRPDDTTLATVQPILPSQSYAAANAGGFLFSHDGIAVENPGPNPVDVLFQSLSVYINDGEIVVPTSVTLPPYSLYIDSGHALGADGTDRASLNILPSAPIRAIRFSATAGGIVTPIPVPVTQIVATVDGATQPAFPTDTLSVHAVAGNIVSRVLDLMQVGPPIPFTAAVSIQTGAGWLTIAPSAGSTCTLLVSSNPTANCPAASKINLTFDTTKLAPGTYGAALTFMPQGYNPVATVTPVTLTVESQPLIFANPASLSLSTETQSASQTTTINVTSNLDPLNYSVTVNLPSSQTWLTAGAPSGTTPSAISLTSNLTGLPAGHYTATVTIAGPNNSITIPVDVQNENPLDDPFLVTPSLVNVSLQAGSSAISQSFSATATYYPLTTSAQTSDGTNWLTSFIHPDQNYPYVVANIDPSKLTPGVYHGTIFVYSQRASTPLLVPVTLTVYDQPPPVTLSSPSVQLTAQAGLQSGGQLVTVSTGALSLPFSITPSTGVVPNWLGAAGVVSSTNLTAITNPVTPGTVYIGATALNLTPGVYMGKVQISAPPGSSNSAEIGVTLTVIPVSGPPPQSGAVQLVSAIRNGASQTDGSLAPGEIVSIFGQNIGPATPAGLTYGSDGKVATALGGAEVRFDGKPAPLLYASATQLNAIVPYDVAEETSVEVRLNGSLLSTNALPVASSAPAIFTLNATGVGAAAVLNQDNSVNTPANPAKPASTIQLFATGAGLLNPPGVTGEITGTAPKIPVLPVTVTIGGVNATVVDAVAAPNSVSGLLQVNIIVPPTAASGTSVPIAIKIGNTVSPDGVTIAIQ